VLVAPFIRPANKVGDTPPLPYYLYCLIGIAVIVFGILYWAIWQLLLRLLPYVQVPPRSEKGDSRGRDGGHFGELANLVLHGDALGGMTRADYGLSSPVKRWQASDKEDDKVMRDARDEELFLGQYY
jgi:hypothetical protein